MSTWMISPHLIDTILLLTGIEAAALVLWRRRHGRAPHVAGVLTLLLPGICLMLALRAALAAAAWPWVPMSLAAAFVAHLADLWRRGRAV